MGKKVKDIPKATIAVLLVLTILVSVIGTWTVLEAISSGQDENFQGVTRSSQGNIKLVIEKPVETNPDNANIMLNIEKPN
jgi:amino acid transporter